MQNLIDSVLSELKSVTFVMVLIGGLGIVFRDFLSKYFGKRSEVEIAKLKNDFHIQNSITQDLQSHILLGQRTRNEKLIEKQISASDELWQKLVKNNNQRHLVEQLKIFKVNEINATFREGNPPKDLVQFFNMLKNTYPAPEQSERHIENNNVSVKTNRVQHLRPFVSPLCWALYRAHEAILTQAQIVFLCWQNAMDPEEFFKLDIREVVQTALPNKRQYLDEVGFIGCYYLLDEVEESFLFELNRFLTEGQDEKTLKIAERLMSKIGSELSITDLPSTSKN